ncbi:hypothetical protein SDC9_185509 [bioreactor metagenome]|uniref:Uncharacterized protein n=1 Tax=bioreactor metagenome TaxID=1076179 RepID=A0A645HG24_9ZZZZ
MPAQPGSCSARTPSVFCCRTARTRQRQSSSAWARMRGPSAFRARRRSPARASAIAQPATALSSRKKRLRWSAAATRRFRTRYISRASAPASPLCTAAMNSAQPPCLWKRRGPCRTFTLRSPRCPPPWSVKSRWRG